EAAGDRAAFDRQRLERGSPLLAEVVVLLRILEIPCEDVLGPGFASLEIEQGLIGRERRLRTADVQRRFPHHVDGQDRGNGDEENGHQHGHSALSFAEPAHPATSMRRQIAPMPSSSTAIRTARGCSVKAAVFCPVDASPAVLSGGQSMWASPPASMKVISKPMTPLSSTLRNGVVANVRSVTGQ